jgi:hypothetical protein
MAVCASEIPLLIFQNNSRDANHTENMFSAIYAPTYAPSKIVARDPISSKRDTTGFTTKDLHKREWVCDFCNIGIFKSSKCFRDHLLEQHRPQGVSNDQANVWVDQGERAAESPQICPILW